MVQTTKGSWPAELSTFRSFQLSQIACYKVIRVRVVVFSNDIEFFRFNFRFRLLSKCSTFTFCNWSFFLFYFEKNTFWIFYMIMRYIGYVLSTQYLKHNNVMIEMFFNHQYAWSMLSRRLKITWSCFFFIAQTLSYRGKKFSYIFYEEHFKMF